MGKWGEFEGGETPFCCAGQKGFRPPQEKKQRLFYVDHRQSARNGGIELLFFRELGVEFGAELCEALGEVEVVVLVGQADVASGGEDVVEFGHAGEGDGGAEAFDVRIVAVDIAPVVVRIADGGDILRGEDAGPAVDEFAHVAGVDEEYLAGAVAEAVIGAVAREEPEGRGYLGIEKELGGQVDDAVHEVALLDHAAAYVAFAIGLAGEGALGEDDARLTARGEVEGEVLEPGEVGIAHGGHAVLPAGVLAELVAAPVAVVEGGIGEDVVRADVLVGVVEEGAFAVPFDL